MSEMDGSCAANAWKSSLGNSGRHYSGWEVGTRVVTSSISTSLGFLGGDAESAITSWPLFLVIGGMLLYKAKMLVKFHQKAGFLAKI